MINTAIFDFPIPIEKPEIGNPEKASLKQMHANRRNAKLSTGPKTEAGKGIVAKNSLKHGVFSKQILLEGESKKDFENLEAEFYDHFQPQGFLESLFLERALAAAWRLSRVTQMESMLINQAEQKSYGNGRIIEVLSGCEGDELALLSRYEITLEKILFRSLSELRTLQASRKTQYQEFSIDRIGFVPQNLIEESAEEAEDCS